MTQWRYPLARPLLGAEETDAVRLVLESRRLVQGDRVEAFERAIAAYVGVEHAVACSSGTAALHLALWSVGVGAADEVIVPALTFPAPAHAAATLGARPVPCEVDRATWNLAPEAIERALGPRTRAILAVDQFGVPAAWGDLAALAARHKVRLIEDAACALGSSLGGKRCGAFGDVATFSFHPRKVVTTGEGGMVLTDDSALAARARLLRDHGRDPDGTFRSPGLNLRLTEVAAAIGSAQMDKLDRMIEARRRVAAVYREFFGKSSQRVPDGAVDNGQSFGVLARTPAEAAAAIAALRAQGIEASILSYALDRLPSLRRVARLDQGPFTHAWAVADHGLALPIYPELSDDAAREIAAATQAALAHAGGS